MISTKGRYALRIMIDLAEHKDKKCVPLKDISERQGISKKYLEIIVKDLVNSELVEGIHGRNGGYRLTRNPDEYNIAEIIGIMEGSLSSVACLADKDYDCPRKDQCKTLPLWTEFDEMVYDFFGNKKLSELI